VRFLSTPPEFRRLRGLPAAQDGVDGSIYGSCGREKESAMYRGAELAGDPARPTILCTASNGPATQSNPPPRARIVAPARPGLSDGGPVLAGNTSEPRIRWNVFFSFSRTARVLPPPTNRCGRKTGGLLLIESGGGTNAPQPPTFGGQGIPDNLRCADRFGDFFFLKPSSHANDVLLCTDSGVMLSVGPPWDDQDLRCLGQGSIAKIRSARRAASLCMAPWSPCRPPVRKNSGIYFFTTVHGPDCRTGRLAAPGRSSTSAV